MYYYIICFYCCAKNTSNYIKNSLKIVFQCEYKFRFAIKKFIFKKPNYKIFVFDIILLFPHLTKQPKMTSWI